MYIQLLRADIASLKVDAIVAAADAGAKDSPEGEAFVTGGNLLARFVIHVPVPHQNDPAADAKLRQATLNALERAERLAIASVGLPAIGLGPFEFTADRCARAMLEATMEFKPRARSLQRAVFCLFGEKEYEPFEQILKELQG